MPQQQQCYPALPVADPAPTVVNVQTQQSPPMQVVVVGGCPSCRVSKNVVHFFKISLNINFFFIGRCHTYEPHYVLRNFVGYSIVSYRTTVSSVLHKRAMQQLLLH